jgi:hypothetical protein
MVLARHYCSHVLSCVIAVFFLVAVIWPEPPLLLQPDAVQNSKKDCFISFKSFHYMSESFNKILFKSMKCIIID